MATNRTIQTFISMTDNTTRTFIQFDRKIHQSFSGVFKLQNSLKRLDRTSHFKEMRAAVGRFNTGIRNTALQIGVMAASLGAVGIVAKKTISFLDGIASKGDEVAKSSRKLGLGVEELQHFRYAASRCGIETELMDKSIQKLAINSYKAFSGDKEMSKKFASLGIRVADANGKIKTNAEMLYSLSDAFTKLKSPQEKIFVATQMFGDEGAKMVSLLAEGRMGVKQLINESAGLGVMTKEQAENSEKYVDAMTDLKRVFDNLKAAIGAELLPTAIDAVKKISSYFKEHKKEIVGAFKPLIEQIPELVKIIVENLPSAIKGFGKLMSVVNKAVKFFGVTKIAFVAVFSGIMAPLWGCIKAFGFFAKIGLKAMGMLWFGPKGAGDTIFAKAIKKTGMLVTHFAKFIGPKFKDVFLNLGKKIGPLMKSIGPKLINSFSFVGKRLLTGLRAFGTGVLGGGTKLFSRLTTVLPKLIQLLPKVFSGIKMLGPAVGRLLGPVGLAITAFQIWSKVFKCVYDNFDLLKSFNFDDLKFIFNSILDTLSPIVDKISGFASAVGNFVSGIGTFLGKTFLPNMPRISPEQSIPQSPTVQMAAANSSVIYKNTSSSLDVNFNNIPQNVTVQRQSGNFEGIKYGMNYSFAK